jgi:hypothetical protein
MHPTRTQTEQALGEAEALLLHLKSQDITDIHPDVFAILIDSTIQRIQTASEFIENIK